MKYVFTLLTLFTMPLLAGIVLNEAVVDFPSGYPAGFNPEHLDGPFTGGFGEQTCHSCHFDYDINMDSGSLTLTGLKNSYRPGSSYDITVSLESKQLENGGFQMTARFEDGSAAGIFDWQGNKLMFTPDTGNDVPYLQHSAAGTRPTGERIIEWAFTWQAPVERSGKVIINIAANAGNDDDSAFGDHIYVKEISLEVREPDAGTGTGTNPEPGTDSAGC